MGISAAWRTDSDLVRAAVRLTLVSGGGPGMDLPLIWHGPATGGWGTVWPPSAGTLATAIGTRLAMRILTAGIALSGLVFLTTPHAAPRRPHPARAPNNRPRNRNRRVSVRYLRDPCEDHRRPMAPCSTCAVNSSGDIAVVSRRARPGKGINIHRLHACAASAAVRHERLLIVAGLGAVRGCCALLMLRSLTCWWFTEERGDRPRCSLRQGGLGLGCGRG